MLAANSSVLNWSSAPALADVGDEVEPKDSIVLPPVANPAVYAATRFNVYTGDSQGEHRISFAKGTTTLAFKFQGGVIVSVDSRSTQGPYIGTLSLLLSDIY